MCLDCPPGYDCSIPSQPFPCAPGEISTIYGLRCDECQAGFDCSQEGTAEEKLCPKGHHCLDPAIPTQCDQGHTLNYMYLYRTVYLGKYSWDSSRPVLSCIDCEQGYIASNKGSESCSMCEGGKFTEDAIECLPCEKGNYCTEGIMKRCEPGTRADEPGLTECLECHEGYECRFPAEPKLCQDGWQPNQDQTECIACGAGFYCREFKPL